MNNIKGLPPFKRFCVTIGNLPSSYVDSMSYYECVMWLCKYLKETVIPAVNENAEAVNELINWFNNLDVQDEIDNKLDEMVESGELQEIISEYLNSTAVFGFDSVSDMVSSENLINGSYAKTTGYYTKNDGGSGLYKIRTITNDDIVDGGSIIEMNDDTLVAELIITNKTINVKQFGAKGDSTTDDSEVIQTAINYCINNNISLYIDKSEYLVESGLDISSDNFNLKCDGTLKTTQNIELLKVKGYYNNIYINKLKSSSRTGTAFKSTGKLGFSNIKIDVIDDFSKGIEINTSVNKTGGVLYNYIYSNFILADNCIILNANTSYINNNYFYLGELLGGTGIKTESITEGTGEYNGNMFNNAGFENLVTCVDLNNATRNSFRDFRLYESITGDTFIKLNNSGKNYFESFDTSAILQNSKITDNSTRNNANIFNCYITQQGSVTSEYCTKALSYSNKFEIIENNNVPSRVSLANGEYYMANQNSLNAYNEISTYNSEADVVIHLDEKYEYHNIYTNNFVLWISFIAGNHNIQIYDNSNNKIFDLNDYRSQVTSGGSALFRFDLYNKKLYPTLIYKS